MLLKRSKELAELRDNSSLDDKLFSSPCLHIAVMESRPRDSQAASEEAA